MKGLIGSLFGFVGAMFLFVQAVVWAHALQPPWDTIVNVIALIPMYIGIGFILHFYSRVLK